MSLRFQADADLKPAILLATVRLEPGIDFRSAEEAGLAGLPDPVVLDLAGREGRILVTHDHRTMPHHFAAFLAHSASPGVIVVRQHLPVASVAEELVLIWAATSSEEWVNQILYLPV